MYDIQSQEIIDYWTMVEDKYDNASMTLYNKLQNNNITISNNNEMKYLEVCINNYTNNQKTFEYYTHIHSFVNDMLTLYDVNVFQDYVIKYNDCISKKRYVDNIEDNKIKRTKYE
jgi:hypothetical protein